MTTIKTLRALVQRLLKGKLSNMIVIRVAGDGKEFHIYEIQHFNKINETVIWVRF